MYNAKFLFIMNYRKFIINLILSIVALYLIGIIIAFIMMFFSLSS